MLEVTARDGRARTTQWQPTKDGPKATTPTLVWPETTLAAAPPNVTVTLASPSAPEPASPGIRITSGGTWFHPVEGGAALHLPALQPAPSTKVQTILAGPELAVLHDAAAWASNPKNLVPALVEARTTATSGRLLWLPALGTPADYAVWAYLGCDLFDASPLLLAAARGQALTTDGPLTAAQAAALHGEPEAAWTFARLLQHNVAAAQAELALVAHHIRAGTLRGLAERRAYVAARTVETLRLFDREHAYLEAASPHQASAVLPCMTVESLGMPPVESFRRRVRDAYQPPTSPAVDILVLMPCSARKPYKLSRSHRHYIRALEDSGLRARVHEVMVTSPLGLVPRELEELYPANAYDIPVTGHWMLDEQQVVREQLRSLLSKGQYKHVIAHVGKHTLDALRDLLPPDTRDTVLVHPTNHDDTKRLAQALRDIGAADPKHVPSWPARRLMDMRALASFQFGPAVAADLCADAQTFGRPPFVKLEGPEGQRATTTSERGQLSLTLAGAGILAKHATHRVGLKDFQLKGTSSLFAVGVETADGDIRVGDEVVLMQRGQVVGGGTALMTGEEMVSLNRGVAVQVRHIVGKEKAAAAPMEVTA